MHPGGTSLFAPLRGSAPRYVGQGAVNQGNRYAAIGALALQLEHSGEQATARALEGAIRARQPLLPTRANGSLRTAQMSDLVPAEFDGGHA